ncbi:MAG: hypothetical protein AAGJ35_14790 [Myxococcota bacterium]
MADNQIGTCVFVQQHRNNRLFGEQQIQGDQNVQRFARQMPDGWIPMKQFVLIEMFEEGLSVFIKLCNLVCNSRVRLCPVPQRKVVRRCKDLDPVREALTM